MPRRVQDIVPGERRSIRDIPVEDRPAPKREAQKEASKEPARAPIALRRLPLTPPPAPEPRRRKKGGGKGFLVFLGVLILVAGAAFAASFYFSRATFAITPRSMPFSVSSTYVVEANPAPGVLGYKVVTLRQSASTTVPAVDGPSASVKAQGKVTVYNAYSVEPQRLVAGTRMSGTSGLIYRLTSSIVIPGYTIVGGKTSPGSASATAIADAAGASYNISKAEAGDMKMVAYKGTPKYDSVYARLSADMAGGFAGTKKTVSPAVLASTTAMLKAGLTQSLSAAAKGQVPETDILYDKAVISSFSAPSISGGDTGEAVIGLTATVNAIIFDRSDLIRKIAGDEAQSSFGSFQYEARGLEALDFSIANAKDFSAEKKTSLIFRLKGDVKLVGVVPVNEIKAKLAGARLSETGAILKPYYDPVIESGTGEIIPPWSRVPTDKSRIIINIQDI